VAATSLQSAFVQVGRLRLHHTFAGRGEPTIVLLHGLGSSGYTEWRHNLPVLARTHTVYAPDLPGFGRSAKPRVRYDLAFFTRVLETYLTRLPRGSLVVVAPPWARASRSSWLSATPGESPGWDWWLRPVWARPKFSSTIR
jgi:hypothetical protein